AREVAPRGAEFEITEQTFDQQLERAAVQVSLRADVRSHAREGVEVRRDELDFRRYADGAEELPRDRAEEGLGEFGVRQTFDLRRELVADARPQRPIKRLRSELQTQLRDGLVDEPIVELDALDRVALASLPVARIETHRRPPRDDPELSVVKPKRLDD